MVHNNIFVDSLETIRKARNQTIAEFAGSIGIPKSTLCDLLTTGNATLDTVIRISEGLNIPLWRLFYDDQHNDLAIEKFGAAQWVLIGLESLAQLSPEGRHKIAFTIEEVLRDEESYTVATAY